MYGWLGFDFPDVGTRVMVLMQQSSSLVLTGEVNSVAIVEDNQKVKLYQGTTMGQWTPELYEEAYSAYLAGQISSLSEPKNMDNPNDSGAGFGVMPHHMQHKAYVILTIALVCTVLLITIMLCYRIIPRKK